MKIIDVTAPGRERIASDNATAGPTTTPGRRGPLAAARALVLSCTLSILGMLALLASRAQRRSERGDVPGWVMVTLMSALLVVAIYAIAGNALADLFNKAIGRVSGLE